MLTEAEIESMSFRRITELFIGDQFRYRDKHYTLVNDEELRASYTNHQREGRPKQIDRIPRDAIVEI
jgi:hypothetical protein